MKSRAGVDWKNEFISMQSWTIRSAKNKSKAEEERVEDELRRAATLQHRKQS